MRVYRPLQSLAGERGWDGYDARVGPVLLISTSSRPWLGGVLALVSAISFALNVPFVALVYEHGGNIHAVNLVRPWFFLLCVGVWLLITRPSLRIPRKQLSLSLVIGAAFMIEFYGVHSAIHFIPVGLAILVLYIYPIMVTVITSVMERRRPRLSMIGAMLVVFVGLGFALRATAETFNWLGIAFAFAATVGMCTLVMVSAPAMQGQKRSVVMTYALSGAALMMTLVALGGAPIVFPGSAAGLMSLLAATALYTLATCLLFVAVSMIGPLGFAVIDSTVPVWAILFGFLILGEALTGMQYFGALLVIAGVTVLQIVQHVKGRPVNGRPAKATEDTG